MLCVLFSLLSTSMTVFEWIRTLLFLPYFLNSECMCIIMIMPFMFMPLILRISEFSFFSVWNLKFEGRNALNANCKLWCFFHFLFILILNWFISNMRNHMQSGWQGKVFCIQLIGVAFEKIYAYAISDIGWKSVRCFCSDVDCWLFAVGTSVSC